MSGALMATKWERRVASKSRDLLLICASYLYTAKADEVASLFVQGAVDADRLLHRARRDWKNPHERTKFDLDAMSNSQCKLATRFNKDKFRKLFHALRMPAQYRTKHGGMVISGEEALWIFLVRMANPGTWHILGPTMHHVHRPVCSDIFYQVLDHVYSYKHCINDINRWSRHMPAFRETLKRNGCPFDTCIGFIDGTLVAMNRPRGGYSPVTMDGIQRSVYSGHKKRHGLKYQCVILPNGIIGDFYGPVLGRRTDGFMLAQSNLLNRMHTLQIGGVQYVVYGDPAYALSRYIVRAYKGPNLSARRRRLNRRMRPLRISVEWGFGGIEQQWGLLRYPKGMYLMKQPLAKIYTAAALLHNLHVLSGHGNLTLNWFATKGNTTDDIDSTPIRQTLPTMDEYLHAAQL